MAHNSRMAVTPMQVLAPAPAAGMSRVGVLYMDQMDQPNPGTVIDAHLERISGPEAERFLEWVRSWNPLPEAPPLSESEAAIEKFVDDSLTRLYPRPGRVALAGYIWWLRDQMDRGLIHPETCRAYLADAEHLGVWLLDHGISIALLASEDLLTYIGELTTRYRQSTVKRKIASLRALCQYLFDNGQVLHNLNVNLSSLRLHSDPQHQPPRLATSTLQRLLDAPKQDRKGIRDRAILSLMMHGLTVCEVCRLVLTDIEQDPDGTATLRVEGRGGKERIVILSREANTALRRWLRQRALLHPDNRAVFLSLHWTSGRSEPLRPISTRGVRQMVDGYLRLIGAKDRRVSCQSLRRAKPS